MKVKNFAWAVLAACVWPSRGFCGPHQTHYQTHLETPGASSPHWSLSALSQMGRVTIQDSAGLAHVMATSLKIDPLPTSPADAPTSLTGIQVDYILGTAFGVMREFPGKSFELHWDEGKGELVLQPVEADSSPIVIRRSDAESIQHHGDFQMPGLVSSRLVREGGVSEQDLSKLFDQDTAPHSSGLRLNWSAGGNIGEMDAGIASAGSEELPGFVFPGPLGVRSNLLSGLLSRGQAHDPHDVAWYVSKLYQAGGAVPRGFDPTQGLRDLEHLEMVNGHLERLAAEKPRLLIPSPKGVVNILQGLAAIEEELKSILGMEFELFGREGQRGMSHGQPTRFVGHSLPATKTGIYLPSTKKGAVLDPSSGQYDGLQVLLPGVGFEHSNASALMGVAATFNNSRDAKVPALGALRLYSMPFDVTMNGLGKGMPIIFGSGRGLVAVQRHLILLLKFLFPDLPIFLSGRSQGGAAAMEYARHHGDVAGIIAMGASHPDLSIVRASSDQTEEIANDTNSGYHLLHEPWFTYTVFTPQFGIHGDASAVPHLVLLGEQDPEYPQPRYREAHQDWAQRDLDRRKVVVFPGRGHNLWERRGDNDPDYGAVIAEMADFISGIIAP